MDTTLTQIRYYGGTWEFSLGGGDDPVALSKSFTVYATNLLGEEKELILGEDYTIQNLTTQFHTLEGTTITEVLQTRYGYDEYQNRCCPFTCYGGGYCSFDVVLTSSGDNIRIFASRLDFQMINSVLL